MASFKRTGDMIEIGATVRIEPGPRLLKAKATPELLANDATADHYFAGEREVDGVTDGNGDPVMHTGIDALAEPIEIGKEMSYLDWLAFQRDGDANDRVFYLYQLQKPTAAERKARESDEPFYREIGTFETEEEAISAGLDLKPDLEVGMAYLNDNTLDNGLAALKAAASAITICSAEPATYTAATSGATYLGINTFGAGAVYPNAIAAGSPSGRKLTTAPVTAGTVAATGTASHYAVVSAGASRLEVAQSLSATQGVTAGNTFTLTAADVRLPNVGG